MYCTRNFVTKKQFREAVKRWNWFMEAKGACPRTATENDHEWFLRKAAWIAKEKGTVIQSVPLPVTLFAPGLGKPVMNGQETVEGPHYPRPHTWYARVTVEQGIVIKVV